MRRVFEAQQREAYEGYVQQMAVGQLTRRFGGRIADEIYEATRDQLMQNLRMELQQAGMTWEQFVAQNGGEQQFGMMLMMQTREVLVQGFCLDAVYRHERLTLTDKGSGGACLGMNPQAVQDDAAAAGGSGRGFALRETAERLKAARFVASSGEDHRSRRSQPLPRDASKGREAGSQKRKACLEAGSAPVPAFGPPTTRAEADARGWVIRSIFVYVPRRLRGSSLVRERHHHAGVESHGYKVGFIAQPDWNDPESVAVFGEPRLGFLVSAGNMDSMVNHYGEQKRRRDDAYTPGGKGRRAPQPRGRGLFEPHSPHLQGNAYHFGRHRGESAPARPLRLLVRFPQALHLARFRGRSHLLRHGGALSSRLPMPSLRAFP